MLLSQVRQVDGQRVVVAREGQMAWIVPGATSVYALGQTALSAGQRLEEEIAVRGHGGPIDLAQALAESHSLGNLEHHHFKYDVFRQPGDVHVHFFGTATLSFTDEIRVDHGDVFEIASPVFGLPLRNPLEQCQATHYPVYIARL